MHVVQPKHSKLKPEEVAQLLEKYNISLSQLPKIKIGDAAWPPGCNVGDVVKIERRLKGKIMEYFRVITA